MYRKTIYVLPPIPVLNHQQLIWIVGSIFFVEKYILTILTIYLKLKIKILSQLIILFTI